MRMGWVLPWLWVCWMGFCCPLEGQEQVRLGMGQECGGTVVELCDTNLTCVPVNVSDAVEAPSSGVCSLTTLSPGCVPCSAVQCPRARRACPGGHVTEPCGCCPQCARQKGQVCGGPHWERGYCDRGLTCALFLGQAHASPPQIGVCKVLPGRRPDAMADSLCPWLWGCNVRVGACDCYGLQTCHTAFSYHNLQDCLKAMQADEQYSYGEEDELDEEQACVEWSCEVREGQCACQERKCSSHMPRLSEDACEDLLKQAKCSNVSCPEVPPPSCPLDSFLSEPYTAPGQCCPLLPAQCTCAFENCPSEPPTCPPGQYAHQVTRGNGQPGTCCHHYLCAQRQGQPDSKKRDEEED